jgi:hypothetical protein
MTADCGPSTAMLLACSAYQQRTAPDPALDDQSPCKQCDPRERNPR